MSIQQQQWQASSQGAGRGGTQQRKPPARLPALDPALPPTASQPPLRRTRQCRYIQPRGQPCGQPAAGVVIDQGLPRLPPRLVGQAEGRLVGCLLLQLEVVSSDVHAQVQLQGQAVGG